MPCAKWVHPDAWKAHKATTDHKQMAALKPIIDNVPHEMKWGTVETHTPAVKTGPLKGQPITPPPSTAIKRLRDNPHAKPNGIMWARTGDTFRKVKVG